MLSVASLLALLAVAPALPVTLTQAEKDTLRVHVERDRLDTREWLKSGPTSYLATVDRVDFGDRTALTVGRAPGNDVRIEDPEIADRHLTVTVVGDSFRVEAATPGATFKVKSVEMLAATLGPSAIAIGRYSLRLSHQRYPAIIVFDPKSPRYREYKGIEYFPTDFSYRFLLPLTANPAPDTVTIMSTRGNARRAVRAGWFDFQVGKTACRLEATRLLEPGVGENDLGVFLRDATTGKETYAVGRYVDIGRQDDGRYVLDFNNAYNPACAYSIHYNCPIPPKANLLKVAIRAGEKDLHYLH